jgi:putative phage-type endonuclease
VGYVKQRSKKWIKSRQEKVTASKVAAIIGHNVKCSREAVFNAEVGKTPPFRGNIFTAHGITYEPVALHRYMEITKTIGLKFGLIPHPQYDYIGGSPDLITLDGILVEVKCPYYKKQDRIEALMKGEVPKMYMPQIQLGLEITGLDFAHYVEYYPARKSTGQKEEIFITEVKKDPLWFSTHLPVIQEFHTHLVEFMERKKELVVRVLQNWFRFRKSPGTPRHLLLSFYNYRCLLRHLERVKKVKEEVDLKSLEMMNVDIS